MIVVTGGAGFIGSVLVWALNRRGREDILIVDHLGTNEKWHNLVGLSFVDYLDKAEFIDSLDQGRFDGAVEAIFHLGACSSTTESDAGYLMENNYRYTLRIGTWWEHHPEVRFVYASSAATYGDGSRGHGDDEALLPRLRPLNMYGYSKHLFDLVAARRGWLSRAVGLKYFNVYGPNESHKGPMRSLVNKAFPGVRDEGRIRLFKSHRPEYQDGEQVRDFVYVKDAVEMTLFFMDRPEIHGVFNIGTGNARSWNDLAAALFAATGREGTVEYAPMPEAIRPKYQYHTQADMSKLRTAGYTGECRSLEQGIAEYVQTYLMPGVSITGAP